jgi:hypothetical protein
MITLAPFAPWHLRALYGGASQVAGQPLDELGAMYVQKGPSFTGLDDGVVVGAAGLLFLIPGVAEAWMILPKVGDGLQRRFTARTCQQWLGNMAALHGLRRIQARVDLTQPAHVRFINWLGFVYEGTLTQFGPEGQSYGMYAWFPGTPRRKRRESCPKAPQASR